MNIDDFKKYTVEYLKKHTIGFLIQTCTLFYIGNMNFAIETGKSFSVKGSLFAVPLIILALIINVIYFHKREDK